MQPANPVVMGALFWTAVLGCAVAQFFILRTAFRPLTPGSNAGFAHSGSADSGSTDSGFADSATPERMIPSSRRPMEIMWAILPVFLLAAAFSLAWQAMHPMPVTTLVSRLT